MDAKQMKEIASTMRKVAESLRRDGVVKKAEKLDSQHVLNFLRFFGAKQ